jgi:hypothetical protein
LANLRQYPAMPGHGARAIPACQQHDRDPFKRFGDRGVVLEIAVYYLDTFWRIEWGRVANKGANLGTGANKGIMAHLVIFAPSVGRKNL